MDKGAHFYQCDLQVHTPRDPKWVGLNCVSDDEREDYAKRFVDACRKKSIHAVGITDHHDMTFVQYIRDAAANETDENGNEIDKRDRLVVFPGMELTLSIPCQALLLLDANFPLNLLESLYTVLGITPTASMESKNSSNVSRIRSFDTLADLYKRLDEHDHLKGQYIVLPHVGNKGDFSIIRKGMGDKYSKMPCVGGYLDGKYANLNNGKKDIVNGKDKNWGNRQIGIIQTSDARRDDFTTLGNATSWVKWTEPTAEALRQACLARETRILQERPELPSLRIEAVRVSNSKFLGPVNLLLNPQFNCLIGGRGTGKSTILEYIRWALNDQPQSGSPTDELPDYEQKSKKLIDNTLERFDASVTVTYLVRGVRHVIQKFSENKKNLLRIGDGAFQEVSDEEVRRMLPLQAYSQKQLSAVATRKEELRRFIEAPVKEQISSFKEEVEELKGNIRSAFEKVQKKKRLQREKRQLELSQSSVKKQISHLQKQITGLSKEEKATLDSNSMFQVSRECVAKWKSEADLLLSSLSSLRADIKEAPSAISEDQEIAHRELLESLQKCYNDLFDKARRGVDELVAVFDAETALPTNIEGFAVAVDTWQKADDEQKNAYETVVKAKVDSEAIAKQIGELENRLNAVGAQIQRKDSEIQEEGMPEDEYMTSRKRWAKLYSRRAALLSEKCRELTELSGGLIEADLMRAGNFNTAKNEMASALRGSGVKGTKIDKLLSSVVESESPPDTWSFILDEIRQLADYDADKNASEKFPDTPLMFAAGFNSDEVQKIASVLDPQKWLSLSLVELEDVPSFKYVRGVNEEIEFVDASAGQQATALLTVLLNQDGPPLIIDQPEEDLDNPTMLKVVEQLWKAKERRQMIFASHNANIVVNGDADLVVCCSYRDEAEHTFGEIKHAGAIDVGEINDEIAKVMEGGEKAFQLRRDKYGF